MNHNEIFFKEAAKHALPDTQAVRDRILRHQQAPRHQAKNWLPILAAACCTLLLLGSVPGVRAAVTSWFGTNESVGSFVAEEPSRRPHTPELEQYLQDSPAALEVTDILPEWSDWAKEVSLEVIDVYFDGQKLIVGCTLTPAGSTDSLPDGELYLSTNNIVSLNGHPYIVDGHTDYAGRNPGDPARFALTMDMASLQELSADLDLSGDPKDIQARIESLVASGHTQPVQLSGEKEAQVTLPLVFVDYTKGTVQDDGIVHPGEQIGQLQLTFSFNADNASSISRTIPLDQEVRFTGTGTCTFIEEKAGVLLAENRELDLSGIVLSAARLEIQPTGTELVLKLLPPPSLATSDMTAIAGSLSYEVSAMGESIAVSSQTLTDANGDGVVEIRLHLDLLASETEALDSVVITPVLSYMTACTLKNGSVAYLTEPIRIPSHMEAGWTEETAVLPENALHVTLA